MRSALLFVVVVGCVPAAQPTAPTPQYAQAIAKMCEVDKLAGLSADADPFELARQRTEWVSRNASEPDAIELRVYMSMKGAEDQATMLRGEAKTVGLRQCPLADTLASAKMGGFSQ